ncbi:DUF5996 family protein [soil metagenome]
MIDDADWPALPLDAWEPTRATLHMWCQIIGKVRLALSPYANHWWQVPLYVSARGLTTSAIPYKGRLFEVEFDFIGHVLRLTVSDGATRTLRLTAKSVAAFHAEFMAALEALGIEVRIWTMPVEIPDPIAFEKDTLHATYDPDYANRFWKVLTRVDAVFKEFRGGFIGKASPVHFFWGSFDLAVTRFSGRRAPPMPEADSITREGYSHEVSSVGWWPGDVSAPYPAFYAYGAPEPAGFAKAPLRPAAAFYDTDVSQFRLKYDDVRLSDAPRRALLDFCQSTYEAAAMLARWDRAELERSPTASS